MTFELKPALLNQAPSRCTAVRAEPIGPTHRGSPHRTRTQASADAALAGRVAAADAVRNDAAGRCAARLAAVAASGDRRPVHAVEPRRVDGLVEPPPVRARDRARNRP